MINLNVSHLTSRFPHLKHGYTLIELLVTITLSTLLITFGVSAYRLAADRQLIKSQTELIISSLAQAQKAATSGKTDCPGPYLGERVQIVSGISDITFQSICETDPQGSIRSISLSGFNFSNNLTIIFRPLNQGIDTGASSPAHLDYSLGDQTYRIEITRSGSIKALGEI